MSNKQPIDPLTLAGTPAEKDAARQWLRSLAMMQGNRHAEVALLEWARLAALADANLCKCAKDKHG